MSKKVMQYSHALSCARCGRPLDINEYIQNSRLISVIKTQVVLHFCNSCIELIDRGDE